MAGAIGVIFSGNRRMAFTSKEEKGFSTANPREELFVLRWERFL